MKSIMEKLQKIALMSVLVVGVSLSTNYVYKTVIDYQKLQESVYVLGDEDTIKNQINQQNSIEHFNGIKRLHLKLIADKNISYEQMNDITIKTLNSSPNTFEKIDKNSYEYKVESKIYENLNLDYLKYIQIDDSGKKSFDKQSYDSNVNYFTEFMTIKYSDFLKTKKIDNVKMKQIIKQIVINESQFSGSYPDFNKNFINDINFLTKMYSDTKFDTNNFNIEKLKSDYIKKYEITENERNIFNNPDTNNFYNKFKGLSEVASKVKNFETLIKDDFKDYQYDVQKLESSTNKINYLSMMKKYVDKISSVDKISMMKVSQESSSPKL